jgi:hypothetical protein
LPACADGSLAYLHKVCPLYDRWFSIIGDIIATFDQTTGNMTDQPEARAGTDEAIARLGKARVRVGQIVQDADAQRAVDPVGAARMVETDSDEPLDDDGNKLLRVARNGAASESTVCTEAWGADAVQAKKRTRAQTCQVGDDEVRRHLRQKGAGTVAEDEGVGGVGRGGYLEGRHSGQTRRSWQGGLRY